MLTRKHVDWSRSCERRGPAAPSQMFGGLLRNLRPAWAVLAPLSTVQPIVFALVAAMPVPSGSLCTLQHVMLIAIGVAPAATFCVLDPYRVRASGIINLVGALVLAVAIAVAASLAAGTDDASKTEDPASLYAMAVAATLLSAVAVFRAVVAVGVRAIELVYLHDDGRTEIFLERDWSGDGDGDGPHALPRGAFSSRHWTDDHVEALLAVFPGATAKPASAENNLRKPSSAVPEL